MRHVVAGSRFAIISRQAQFNDAKVVFLALLNEALGERGAFDELSQIARSESGGDLDAAIAWVKGWRIDTPFTRLQAVEIVKAVRRDPNSPLRFAVDRQDALPEAWHNRMALLNELRPRVCFLDDGVDAGTLRVQEPGGAGWRVVQAPHDDLLLHEDVLAPISADPCRESQDRFLQRAKHHWQGRALEAERQGARPIAAKPDLERHVRWLVQYQIEGLRYAEIARLDSGATPDAVRKAVHRVAELLHLELRPGTRGRPSKPDK